MDFETQIEIMKLRKERESLVERMENYHKIYRHKIPCDDWKKNRWCIHYVQARTKKFGARVNGHMSQVVSVKKGLYTKDT